MRETEASRQASCHGRNESEPKPERGSSDQEQSLAMTFGRLTLGFGVLLSLVDVTFTAIWGAMHPGTPDEWLSTGDLMVMTGVAAFFVGAAFGLLVWAVWSLSSRLARLPRRVKPPPS